MAKILLIEDDIFISDIYEDSLKKANHVVVCAYDGDEAVEYLKKENFDLVLLDIMLPKQTGLDVLKTLRNELKLDVLVYLLTNLGEENIREQAQKLGSNGYLLKSKFLPKQIVSEIDKILVNVDKPAEPIPITG